MKFELPDLPYEYDALEPHIDKRTMELHHDKHHAGYTKKFNSALEKADIDFDSAEEILKNIEDLPEEIQEAVQNNGGGYVNHKMFWEIMHPKGGGEPTGKIADAIKSTFGDFETFRQEFNDAATGQFGSGWAWLVVDEDNELAIASTPNQDSPYMYGLKPVMGVDVWEHAYYLKYQNKRGSYVAAWWNVVNWSEVEKRYLEMIGE